MTGYAWLDNDTLLNLFQLITKHCSTGAKLFCFWNFLSAAFFGIRESPAKAIWFYEPNLPRKRINKGISLPSLDSADEKSLGLKRTLFNVIVFCFS